MPPNDHNPPHFHIRYNKLEARFGIDPVNLIDGDLPVWVIRAVTKWAVAHHQELLNNWEIARTEGLPEKIEPSISI